MSRFSLSTKCHYLGFIYVDIPHSPAQNEVEHTADLFRNVKRLRKEHPLFARGFSKALELTANSDGIRLDQTRAGKGGSAVVTLPMKKLVYTASVSRSLYVVAKRGANKYNCHNLRMDSVQMASDAAALLQKAIAEHSGSGGMRTRSRSTENLLDFIGEGNTPERVPTLKARRLSSRTKSVDNLLSLEANDSGLSARTSEWSEDTYSTPNKPRKAQQNFGSPDSGLGSEPATPLQAWTAEETTTTPDNPVQDQAAWFRGMITRSQAEALLTQKAAGTFLLRVSQSRVGFSISLVLQTGKLQHFKINQASSGEFYVVGNSYAMFDSLGELVFHYNQRRLTEEHDRLLQPIGPGPTQEDIQEYL